MASFYAYVYILITTLINLSTTAVEKKPCTSLTTIESEADSNASNQHSQLLCSESYYDTFHYWTGEPILGAGYCATYSDYMNFNCYRFLIVHIFNQTVTTIQPQGRFCFPKISVSSMITCVVH